MSIYGSNFAAGNVVQFNPGQGANAGTWTTGNTLAVQSSTHMTVDMNAGTVDDMVYVRVCQSAALTSASDCSWGTRAVEVSTAGINTFPISSFDGGAGVEWKTVAGIAPVDDATHNQFNTQGISLVSQNKTWTIVQKDAAFDLTGTSELHIRFWTDHIANLAGAGLRFNYQTSILPRNCIASLASAASNMGWMVITT